MAVICVPLILLGAGCSVSTAHLEEVMTCDNPKPSGCEKEIVEFASDVPTLYVTAQLKGALDGTKVNYSWKYIEGAEPYEIDMVEYVKKPEDGTSVYSKLSKPTKGWPKGKYSVTLKVVADNSTPVEKFFIVK